MFRCENCGSGYSIRAASAWEACPRCLARERIKIPLSFELGWRGERPLGGRFEHPAPAPQSRKRSSEASLR